MRDYVCAAASSSQKGSHQETREMVMYDDDDIFWRWSCSRLLASETTPQSCVVVVW